MWGVQPPVPDHASALFRRHGEGYSVSGGKGSQAGSRRVLAPCQAPQPLSHSEAAVSGVAHSERHSCRVSGGQLGVEDLTF